jgi:hypothetical protein
MAQSDMTSLKKEVQALHVRYPALSIDNVFVLWFMHSYLVEDEKVAIESLVGATSDWGLDAIYADHPNKKVFCVQAKYRTASSPPTEQRSDLRAFANLGHALHGDDDALKKLLQKADEKVKDRVTQVVRLLKKSEYALDLFFVTTGKVSKALADEAEVIVENAAGPSELTIFSRSQVLSHLQNWLTDAAPGVPSLDLEIEPGSGFIKRSDSKTEIETLVFSMRGTEVGDLYKRAGVRLFARNIRGFLGGDEDVNRAIRDTLDTCPENFWYYNNGVTLVCDRTRRVDKGTHEILRLYNPQVINGQQTTRMLADFGSKKASVLVRVIAIPRQGDGHESKFEELVGSIVQATNWQNEIKASDLRANDFEQVRLQREFRRLGYEYLRKRQSKGEIRRLFGIHRRFLFKRDELAKTVVACELDPFLVREGTERLFESDLYSRIFDGRPAKTYLAMTHLGRLVRVGSRGRPEWGYARSVVINHAWRSLKDEIGSEPGRVKFIYVCERRDQDKKLKYLENFVLHTYRAAAAFFRKTRGKGETALDVSTFFKRRDLDERFETFARSNSNPQRRQIQTALKKFNTVLHEFEVA